MPPGKNGQSNSGQRPPDSTRRVTDAFERRAFLGTSIASGDSWYTYDLIGNITQLRRYSNDYGADQQDIYAYTYPAGNNRLSGVTRNGAANRSITYDNNGNMITDSKRTVTGITYGRANLPFTLQKSVTNPTSTQTMQYLYDVADNRIFKSQYDGSASNPTLNSEFYLRTATGQDFAIVNFAQNEMTWYVSAGERIAQIKAPATYGDPGGGSGTAASVFFPDADFVDDDVLTIIKNDPLLTTLQQFQASHDSLRLPLLLLSVRDSSGANVWRLDSLLPKDIAIDTFVLQTPTQPIAFMLPDSTTYYIPLGDLPGVTVAAAAAPPPPAPVPQPVFYLYDHLGTTRVLFHADVNCTGGTSTYLDYVGDYYPYGKILREYIPAGEPREKYLTTQHERDAETGLDNRGARFYDSELGRFLSVDPLAQNYYSWASYNYVLSNPIIMADPNGKGAIVTIGKGTITVSANFYLYSNEDGIINNINSLAQQYQTELNQQYNNNFLAYTDNSDGQRLPIQFQFNVIPLGGLSEAESRYNELNGPKLPANENFIFLNSCGDGHSASFGNLSVVAVNDDPLTFSHEVGHLMGFLARNPDEMGDPNWDTHVLSADYNGIMGRSPSGRNVIQSDIDGFNFNFGVGRTPTEGRGQSKGWKDTDMRTKAIVGNKREMGNNSDSINQFFKSIDLMWQYINEKD